jgi:hypothetical protein
VPSLNVPVAVNCCVIPNGIVAPAGLIVIDTNPAAVTVSSIDPLTLPTLAVIVAVPIPTLLLSPVLLTVAVNGVSEDQVAVLVKSCVLPSL